MVLQTGLHVHKDYLSWQGLRMELFKRPRGKGSSKLSAPQSKKGVPQKKLAVTKSSGFELVGSEVKLKKNMATIPICRGFSG
ncbi:hypothetical protein HPB48_024004 [Haemaphysalis longicornis]|uniref:Uncharacterized protein n=1 Tax=Haemaphysalis longicornis TaxID=44386 RepID=A0A9J6H7Y5_HAELO|nr:hypothetical protein HPB48_024004 [Haemaphysalis longicornis]